MKFPLIPDATLTDDMSACTLGKRKMDMILDMAYEYSCKWIYIYR